MKSSLNRIDSKYGLFGKCFQTPLKHCLIVHIIGATVWSSYGKVFLYRITTLKMGNFESSLLLILTMLII